MHNHQVNLALGRVQSIQTVFMSIREAVANNDIAAIDRWVNEGLIRCHETVDGVRLDLDMDSRIEFAPVGFEGALAIRFDGAYEGEITKDDKWDRGPVGVFWRRDTTFGSDIPATTIDEACGLARERIAEVMADNFAPVPPAVFAAPNDSPAPDEAGEPVVELADVTFAEDAIEEALGNNAGAMSQRALIDALKAKGEVCPEAAETALESLIEANTVERTGEGLTAILMLRHQTDAGYEALGRAVAAQGERMYADYIASGGTPFYEMGEAA